MTLLRPLSSPSLISLAACVCGQRDGEAYLRTLMRMLSLPAAEYPWGKASFAQPVFANAAAKGLVPSRPAAPRGAEAQQAGSLEPRLARCAQQCAPLLRVTGMLPPWCDAGGTGSASPSEILACSSRPGRPNAGG